MDVSAINPVSSNQTAAAGGNNTKSLGDNLSMDDFFTLLAAQMRYQDPTNPTDNSEYMSQMAQFSLLEQVESLAKSLNVSVASSSVGRGAVYSTTDSQGKTTQSAGTIGAVDISSGTPEYLINGEWVPQSNISDLYDAASSDVASESAVLGRYATYNSTDAQGNTAKLSGTISAVDVSSDAPRYLINGDWVDLSEITEIQAAASGAGA